MDEMPSLTIPNADAGHLRRWGREEEMITAPQRNVIRKRVHKRVRAKIAGTTERPRLNIFRSLNHIYAQVIDDSTHTTLASASTVVKKGEEKKSGGNIAAAQEVGKLV